MFDSLADRMKEDDRQTTNRKELVIRYSAIIILSVVLFGGLYLGVQYLEF
jgi:hypothetical protein